jgi:hypothetical protein
MLIRTIPQIKSYSNIHKNTAWESLAPYVILVEGSIVKSILDTTTLQALEDAIENETLSEEQSTLLSFLMPMIANFSLYHAMPQSNAAFSDLGITSQSSQNGTNSPAAMWQYNDLRVSYFRVADSYREQAYKYLQENKDYFTDWAGSSCYTQFNQLFIRSNTELNAIIGKGESVNTFLSLKTFIEIAEFKYILPTIGRDFSEELKGKRNENTLKPYETILLEYIQKVIGWACLYEAAPTLRVIIQDGVMTTAMPAERSQVFAPISDSQLVSIRQDALDKFSTFLAAFKKYLDDNHTNFPTYEQSDYFTNHIKEYSIPNNRWKKSFRLT